MAEPELVNVGELNIAKVEFGIPETEIIKGNDGKATGEYYKCTIKYRNSKKEPTDLLMLAPEQHCYGIQKEYPFGQEKNEDTFKGYCFTYYCSDPKNNSEPNEREEKFINDLDALTKKLTQHLKDNVDFLPEKAQELASTGKLVTPIARYPKKEVVNEKNPKIKKKVADTTKPRRFNVRVLYGKKSNKFVTRFYGPNDKEIDPFELVNTWGVIEPVLKIEYVYIGESSATFQIKLWEANYTPSSANQHKRLIPRNRHSPEETNPVPENVPETSNPNADLEEESEETEEEKPKPKPAVKRVAKKVSLRPRVSKTDEE